MNITSRSLLTLCFTLFCFVMTSGQTQTAPASQAPTPIVTATVGTGQVRYTSLGEVHQSRLQVFSSDGTQIFDSGLRFGNLIDWKLTDQQGAALADGSYLFLVTVKDFSDHLTQKYGTATIEQDEVYLEQTLRAALPQAQANALDSNKQADILSSIDRIGGAGLNRSAANISTTDTADGNRTTKQSETTSTTKADIPTTNVSGTGTPNRLTKWQDGAGTLIDSAVTESSGNVGINNPSPVYQLDMIRSVTPTLRLMDGGGRYGLFGVDTSGATLTDIATAGDFVFRTNNGKLLFTNRGTNGSIVFATGNSTDTAKMTILGNGNVGIGTTNPTFGRLQVAVDSGAAIYGSATSNSSISILGYNSGETGSGVRGISDGLNGVGMFGISTGSNGVGVRGQGDGLSPSFGVIGFASNTSATNYGVYGETASPNGYGVYGRNVVGGLSGLFDGGNLKVRIEFRQMVLGNMGCSSPFAGISFGDPSGCTNYSLLGDGTNTMINRFAGGTIYFREANSTQMVIIPGGNVGIGTTAPDQLLTVNGNASKPGGGSWATFSDERLKTIDGRFTSGLKALMQLEPLRYRYRTDNALGIKSYGENIGFSAQAVERVVPEAVSKDDKGYLLVNNDPIMWTMLNAIKEQQAEIESLQQQVKAQQRQIVALKRRPSNRRRGR